MKRSRTLAPPVASAARAAFAVSAPDQRRRLLLREDFAKRAAEVVEKVGGGADGRARRGDPSTSCRRSALRVPGRSFRTRGSAPATRRRTGGRCARARPRRGRARAGSCRRGRAERRTSAPRANRGEGEGGPPASPAGVVEADEAREVRRQRVEIDETRSLSFPALLEIAVRHVERARRRRRPATRPASASAHKVRAACRRPPSRRPDRRARGRRPPRAARKATGSRSVARDVQDDVQAEGSIRPRRRQKSRGLDSFGLLH